MVTFSKGWSSSRLGVLTICPRHLWLVTLVSVLIVYSGCENGTNQSNGSNRPNATEINKVKSPVATPEPGLYDTEQPVQLSSPTEGARIYYTLNGDVPSSSSDEYTSAISVKSSSIIKAIAIKAGLGNSDVESFGYVITPKVSGPNTITITQQPSNQTALNDSASFTVVASASDGSAPRFQWQKKESSSSDFMDVSGATSASLSLSNLTHATDNGDQFRVFVYASGSVSLTSQAVTLTVDPCAANGWCTQDLTYYLGGFATSLNISGDGTWNNQTYKSGVLTSLIVINTPPSNQTASGGQASFAVLASVSNAATLSYQWQVKKNGSNDFVNVSSQSIASATLNLANLSFQSDHGDVYRVIVKASGGAVDVVSSVGTLIVYGVPGIPTGLSVIGSDAGVVLSWNVPASNGGKDITDYEIQYSSDTGANWTTFTDGLSPQNTSTIAGLSNGTPHIFRVAAINSEGKGQFSESSISITPNLWLGTKLVSASLPNMTQTSSASNADLVEQGGITTDSMGNVLVTGTLYRKTPIDPSTYEYLSSDLYVTKYSDNGSILWSKQKGILLPSNGKVEGHGVATDSSGNVYVVGSANTSVFGWSRVGDVDLVVIKYDESGVIKWTNVIGKAGRKFYKGRIAVDSTGNVYVVGSAYASGSVPEVVLLSKITGSGEIVWKREQASSSASFTTVGSGLATDSYGNIFVSGSTTDNFDNGNVMNGASHAYLTKYDQAGTRQWTKMYYSGHQTGSSGVAVDRTNNIIITGNGSSYFGGTYYQIVFLASYSNSGNPLWDVTDNFYSSGNWNSGVMADVNAVTTDSNSNIFVIGSTAGGLDGNTSIGQWDFYVKKFNASGDKVWTKQFGGTGITYGTGIAVNSHDSVFASGITYGDLDGTTITRIYDTFVTKYGNAGNKQ
jgi:hypothetical protein